MTSEPTSAQSSTPSGDPGERTSSGPPPVPMVECPACGADLAGTPAGAPCPLCRAYPDDAPLPGVVQDERPCLTCGYMLQGLATSAPCPECGTPIARSLMGNLLRFASPEYVGRLHLGARLVSIGAFCPMLAGAVVMGLHLLTMQTGVSIGSGRSSEIVSAVLEVMGASVSLVGWFFFSEPDPAMVGKDKGEKARRWLRVLVLALVGVNVVGLVFAFIPGLSNAAIQAATKSAAAGGAAPATKPLAAIIAVSSVKILGYGLQAALASVAALYMYSLAVRVPDLGLRKLAKVLVWLQPLLMTVGIIVCGLGPLAAWILTIVAAEKFRKRLGVIRKG